MLQKVSSAIISTLVAMPRTSDTALSAFGERLETWITAGGFEELQSFAVAIGVSSSNLARMMRQPNPPRLRTLKKIASVLDRSLDEVKAAAFGIALPDSAKAPTEPSDTESGIADQGSSEADGESAMRPKEAPTELDELVSTFARLPRKDKNEVLTFLHDRAAAARRRHGHARTKKARG